MRLLVAALVLTFVVAVIASVLAIWPVVADAPWEPDTQAVVQPTVDPCVELRSQFAQAAQSMQVGKVTTYTRSTWNAINLAGQKARCW